MKTALLLGTLLSTMALGSTPALAQDTSADNAAKIEALQQQIQQLKASIDALKASMATTQARGQQAAAPQTTTGQTAPVQVASGQTVPAQTSTAQPVALASTNSATANAAATPAAQTPQTASSGLIKLPDWLANTTIGGKGYINVSNIHQTSDGAKTASNGTQAEMKRFYISIDHQFSHILSANLTTDVRYGSNGLSNDDTVYVKKAYLQAKFAPEFWVRLGAADLPWIPFDEGLYNYRFIENTPIERVRLGTSSDWGLHVGGDIGHGLIGYQVSAVSGEGYKTLERKTDTIDLEGRIDVQPVKGLYFAVGGYTGKLGNSNATLAASDTPYRAKRFDALAAYVHGPVRVGLEYFAAWNWGVTTKDKTTGWSASGSYSIRKDIALFGRYDWVNPDQDSDPAAKDHYFNFGVDWTGVKNVDIALVYKRDQADNIELSTTNGTIGGVDKGIYDEFGVWTQFKF